MNLDELQSVQARERQSSDLQHLRSSFYTEVGEFIGELNEKRTEAVEAADDPFSEPEVRRLTDDIETAKGTVEAIYERRVGKVVKKASIAAAGMPVEEAGLTNEEEALFEELVGRIERNRETVLSVLDGDAPSVSLSGSDPTSGSDPASGSDPTSGSDRTSPEPTPASGEDPDGVTAADLMGRGDDGRSDPPPVGADGGAASPSEPPADPEAPPVEAVPPEPSPLDTPAADADRTDGTSPPGESDASGVPRTTVRITADVGEIVGADDRDYHLGAEDVVTLPEPNADVLVGKDAAERL